MSVSEAFRAWLLAPVITRLHRLEYIVSAAADKIAAEIDAETTRIANVLAGVSQALRDARAAGDPVALQNAVDLALQETVEPAIERLRQVGADPSNPVPDPTPATAAPVDTSTDVEGDDPTDVETDAPAESDSATV